MTAPAPSLADAVRDRYTLERELGRGGMATVYLARDLKHERPVALKVLHPELAASLGPDRFLREIRLTARLRHPHILPVHDSGEAAGRLWYTMPCVEGESLRDRLRRETQLPLDDALRIAREVAEALDYAHRHGIIHRDIKPENILLEEGHAAVADFGVARAIEDAAGDRLTESGLAMGTPSYMSPEQASAERVLDGRSDIYALGCVLYEMLVGEPPFTGPQRAGRDRQAVGRAGAASGRPPRSAGGGGAGSDARACPCAGRPLPADAATPAAPAHERTAIAVLPFQNLSAEGPHTYFAGGLHDELLTQLSKLAALKVISRTSVMGYADGETPVRQIASELGVGSVVEGSVQVLGGRLRVNVQLIDAATEAHLWAERYDRTLEDAFAIQSDVAQQIVAAVGATLSNAEQQGLADAPTANTEAYRLYLQGREYLTRPRLVRQDYEIAQQLFERALALEPDFALARAALSNVHFAMYWSGHDHTPVRAARQREEAEAALRIAPHLPEAHAAMASYFWGRDDRRALDEYAIALKGRPNDAERWGSVGYVHRSLGNWDEGLAALEKATELDPRSAKLFVELALTYEVMRRYADAVRTYNRALGLAPDLYDAAMSKGITYFLWQGQLDTLRAVLSHLPGGVELGEFWRTRPALHVQLLFWERNADSLLHVLRASRVTVFEGAPWLVPSALYAARAHQLRGDRVAALAAFDSARVVLDSVIRKAPDDYRVHWARGLALAGLGRRAEARREASWLQQSLIYREDAHLGAWLADGRARILAHAGDAEAAVDEIERLLARPSWLSVHTLRQAPDWDPLRDHPRFQALLARHAGR